MVALKGRQAAKVRHLAAVEAVLKESSAKRERLRMYVSFQYPTSLVAN
jgi:hypothetical protein